MSMYEPIPHELKESWAKGGIVTGTDDDFYEIAKTELRTNFEKDVWDILNAIFHLLSEKNRKYGDSALNPARIFSKADSVEQIRVRLDDKLNRIKNAQDDDTEDAVMDLTGYLILFMIARDF